MRMKVLLCKDVDGLGLEGETHEVADGYARNRLIPSGAAVAATPEAVRAAAAKVAARRAAAERELHDSQRLAGELDGAEVVIHAAVSEAGKLYGGVGSAMIANALRQEGFHVRDEWVVLPKPLRDAGEHLVRIALPHGLEAEVTVTVESS